jgi:hypothetical protein
MARKIGARWRGTQLACDLFVVGGEDRTMSRGKHLRGVSAKEQRQYEHIKQSAQRSGRYGRRATEVAARTVMKQHKRKGHRRGK